VNQDKQAEVFYGGCSDNPQDAFAHSSHHTEGCVPDGCMLATLDSSGSYGRPVLHVYLP
jgi:hypothetical protein